MHPPYVPPARSAGPSHPRPVGVRQIVKRNQPQRLDLSLPPPGFPLESWRPVPAALPLRGGDPLRVRAGRWLIRLGQALAGEPSVVEVKGRG